MAGKERSGLENAAADLFENARYVLTPSRPEHLADNRVQAFRALIETFGARPITSDPVAHDLAVAYLSHLPQLVSSGLASLIEEKYAGKAMALELAATGFRSVTRLADSPYAVWRDICLTNSENIAAALDSLIQRLEALKLHLTDRELEQEFKQAQKLRARLREAG
jgi:prephenate dehydrogenase